PATASAAATGHQCLSWAISGADDGSPCCEQFYLLRIRSSIQLASDKSIGGGKRTRGRFHYPHPIADGERIQGVSGHMLNSRVLAATQRCLPVTSWQTSILLTSIPEGLDSNKPETAAA